MLRRCFHPIWSGCCPSFPSRLAGRVGRGFRGQDMRQPFVSDSLQAPPLGSNGGSAYMNGIQPPLWAERKLSSDGSEH
jgi:hypothetical protein